MDQTEKRPFLHDPEQAAVYSAFHRKLSAEEEIADGAALLVEQETVLQPSMDLEPIRLIRASAGNTIKLIPVSEVICLEAADKYVNVVTARGESQVRMSPRELAARLEGIDPVQIHRSVLFRPM